MPDASQFATYARLLRLKPVEDLALPQSVPATHQTDQVRRRWRLPDGLPSLMLVVVLPVCLTIYYFGLLAADRYESEARFVLRTPGRTLPSASVTNLLQSAGVARSNDDGYVVKDYLESRDAMDWLEQHEGLKTIFAVGRRDPIWGFPNAFASDTAEGLFWHYQRMMSASFDSATGVSTLKVQAFMPADAQRLASSLLEAAESLVNRLNERARRDAIGSAVREVEHMHQRALAAQAALTAFREREQLIDPSQVTLAVLETIARLAMDVAQTNVQINELTRSSPNAPQIIALRTRQAALEMQIATERQRLAGDARAIAPRIAEYERLMLERGFAEKALVAAMAAVELARVEAQRQQVYLERVAAPGRPDYPAAPWKVLWCLSVTAAGLMAWRAWRILKADALQHVEP